MNARSRLLLIACLATFAVAGPATSALASGARDRAELATLIEHYQSWTLAMAGDSLASLFAPDGEMLREDGTVLRGPAAIAAFLAGFKGAHVDSASVHMEAMQLLGDDAVTWGAFAQTVRLDGRGTARPRGRFVFQWHRQADGRWRLRRALTQPFSR